MCSLARIDQNRLLPSFEPSIEGSFSVYAPYCDLGKEEFLDSPFFLPLRATIASYPLPFSEGEDKEGDESFALTALVEKNGIQAPPFPPERGDKLSQNKEIMQQNQKISSEMPLQLYKDYLKKRISKTSSKSVSTRQLFKEITDRGYRGAFNTAQKFILAIRDKQNRSPESSLNFHKSYLQKRVKKDLSKGGLASKQLFEEITAKGYRGTIRTMQVFLSMIEGSKDKPNEKYLGFYKDYLKKRVTESAPARISIQQLFEEIKAKGYRGSFGRVKAFISIIRNGENRPCEASFQFHRKYIIKRLEEAAPESVSTRKLFEEMKANGYAGAYNTVRAFVSMMRKRRNQKIEASLDFHKEYIKKRINRAVSTKELFEEIKAKGYQGTLRTVQTFVSTIRTIRSPDASFQFHKEYIKKRVEKAVSTSESVSTRQMFEEIQARGYLGAYNTVRAFVSLIREKKSNPEASLQFHKEYIKKKLEGSKSISTRQLFEEIKSNGYLGAYNTVRACVSTIRKMKPSEASLEFQSIPARKHRDSA